MKNIGIKSPCSENWNEMTANEKGAFCQKCASQVHDFTKKTTEEIKQSFRSLAGQAICGRITRTQEIELNNEFEAWTNHQKKLSFQNLVFFSLLVVFGLSLFSCENEQDKKKIRELQTNVLSMVEEKTDSIKEISTQKVEEKWEENYQTESVIVGMMESIDIIEPEVTIEEEVKTIPDLHYGYLGAMSITERYSDFLFQEETQLADEFDEKGNILPKSFEAKAFPNPAVEQSTIELSIPTKNRYEITLFDMTGKLIESIYSGEIERGKFRKEINLSELNPGTYLIFINSSDFKESVQVVKI